MELSCRVRGALWGGEGRVDSPREGRDGGKAVWGPREKPRAAGKMEVSK